MTADTRCSPERCDKLLSVRKIALDERPPADRLAMPTRQIVENHRLVSGSRQDLAGVAADVTCSARDENRLSHSCLPAPRCRRQTT